MYNQVWEARGADATDGNASKFVLLDGDGKRDGKFDLLSFDVCLMGNLELALIMADYTDYYIASAAMGEGIGAAIYRKLKEGT